MELNRKQTVLDTIKCILSNEIIVGSIAVSYTHLDVYKRQLRNK